MLEIALCREDPWPDLDWNAPASRAATAAVLRTPHGYLVTAEGLVEISIRLTSNTQIRTLNRQYRALDKPTNVLSFPMVRPDLLWAIGRNPDGCEVLLGDIVLAYETCAEEAAERGVLPTDHAVHLIVHGTLHLLGYDHMTDDQAEAMEAMERAALGDLGVADPYPAEEA